MIYGFLSDECLYNKPSSGQVIVSSQINSGVGYFTDTALDFFTTPITILDSRSNSPTTNQRLEILAEQAYGEVKLNLDQRHLTDDISALTEGQFKCLFNIIEECYLRQNTSVSALQTLFLNNLSTYGGYVENSLELSTDVTATTAALRYSSTPASVNIRSWIIFDFAVADDVTIKFKIWLNDVAFRTDYPYSDIVKICYPCEPSNILSMMFDNKISALIASANKMLSTISTELSNSEYSGMSIYYSKYVNDALANWYNLPFGVIYKGVAPSTRAMRTAIRDDLLSMNIAPINTWKAALPDLFADSAFYVVPFFSNIFTLPETSINQVIINHNSIYDKMCELFPNMDITYIKENMEVMLSPASNLFLATFPSTENDVAYKSLKTIHPTYQNVDATNAIFDLQAETTKEFNQKISRCIAVVLGKSANTEFSENVVDGKIFMSFVSDFIEFHVLTQESF